MKAILGLMLIFVLSCAFVACGEKEYKVSFSLGEYTGIVAAPNDLTVKEGETIKLPGTDASREGYTFTAWTLGGKDYAVGESYTVTKDVGFIAKWAVVPVEYTVTFGLGEGVEGTAPDAITKASGEKITLPEVGVTRDGYTFEGWMLPSDEKVYAAGAEYTVTASVTFTAKWNSVESQHPDWLEGTWTATAGPTTYTLTFSEEGITLTSLTTSPLPMIPSTEETYTATAFNYDGATAVTFTSTDGIQFKITKAGDKIKVERHTGDDWMDFGGEYTKLSNNL